MTAVNVVTHMKNYTCKTEQQELSIIFLSFLDSLNVKQPEYVSFRFSIDDFPRLNI